MSNMEQIISNHNKAIMTKENKTANATNNCHCHVKETCPVDLEKSGKHQASYTKRPVTRQNNKDKYVGLNDNIFTRYNGHTNSSERKTTRMPTTQSNDIWTLKDKKIR